jgi:hypothetical protein
MKKVILIYTIAILALANALSCEDKQDVKKVDKLSYTNCGWMLKLDGDSIGQRVCFKPFTINSTEQPNIDSVYYGYADWQPRDTTAECGQLQLTYPVCPNTIILINFNTMKK